MIKKILILNICLIVNFLSAQTDSLVGNNQADVGVEEVEAFHE